MRFGLIFSPLGIVILVWVPILVAYSQMSETTFWRIVGAEHVWSSYAELYFGACVILFVTGVLVAQSKPVSGSSALSKPGSPPASARLDTQALENMLRRGLQVGVAAYLLWFGLGVWRAGGIGGLIATYQTDPTRAKDSLLGTIGGVTTLSQLPVAAIPLAVAFDLWRRPRLRLLIATAVAFALVRSFLFSERLALLEIVVPSVFLLLRNSRMSLARSLATYAVMVGLVVAFFVFSESQRSFVYTGNFSVHAGIARFESYYLASIANGTVALTKDAGATPAFNSLYFLWRTPGIRSLDFEYVPIVGRVTLDYQKLTGIPADAIVKGVSASVNHDLTVLSIPGYLALDFGKWGAVLMFVLGFVSGRLWKRGVEDPLFAALYAVWAVGLLEGMRILYFTNQRLIPVYLLFYLVWRRQRRAHAIRPAWHPRLV